MRKTDVFLRIEEGAGRSGEMRGKKEALLVFY